MICLDNDVFSRYASQESYPAVTTYLSDHSTEIWVIPSVVLFEFLQRYSAHDTIREQRRLAEQSVDGVIPVDADVAQQAANMRGRLAAAGTSLAVPDLLVAAAAREADCTLVTRNKNDFDKVPIHQLLDVDIIHASDRP
ncbi:tRNA(fMet)-specific endonuclease VapC [Halalkaliarchaeum desulfuricum]|uniref:Ribonuclease VapC n=1 Tax=Halalkaliarchaeum desulfuricum TaxID=2055893 RepID=A0A343TH27_9EURY|nr:type II toxin-antitoxin system VapC family toxin [Halalkaliarchaeum desulfuricum]AUX08399.1 tRNA(fMet)-specific endonuclease VapC [Halalkaliarchaeum desulfuricum]